MRFPRRTIFLLAVFLVAITLVSLWNFHEAIVYLPGGRTVPMPTSVLIILSFAAGMGLFALLGWIGDLLAPLWGARRRAPRNTRLAKKDLDAGEEAFFEGDLDRAEGLLQRASDRDPTLIRALIRQADICLERAQPGDAVMFLNRASQRAPEDVKLLFRLAEVQEQAGEYGSAIDVLRRIADGNEHNVRAREKLAGLYIRTGRWEDAVKAQEMVERALPKKSPARTLVHTRLKGIRYEYARALKDYAFRTGASTSGEALLRADTDPNLVAVADVKRPLATARKILEDILKDDVEFVPAAVALGDLHARAGDGKQARAVWERTILKKPRSVLLSRLEEHYLKESSPREALEMYRRVAAVQPEDIILQLYRVRFALRLEMVDEAQEMLAQLSARGVDLEALHLLHAEAEYRSGRPEKAVQEFRKALRYDRRIPFPHVCTVCRADYEDWVGFCKSCLSWNSVVSKSRVLHVPVKDITPPPPGYTP